MLNKEIKIEWLSDVYDCDTCGTSWASGANVFINGNLELELTPVAHCYGGEDYSTEDIYIKILNKLGWEVINA